jgi:hypothetical protein
MYLLCTSDRRFDRNQRICRNVESVTYAALNPGDVPSPVVFTVVIDHFREWQTRDRQTAEPAIADMSLRSPSHASIGWMTRSFVTHVDLVGAAHPRLFVDDVCSTTLTP